MKNKKNSFIVLNECIFLLTKGKRCYFRNEKKKERENYLDPNKQHLKLSCSTLYN